MRDDFYENSAAPQKEKLHKTLYTVYSVLFIASVVALVVFLYLLIMFGDTGFIFLSLFSLLFAVTTYLIRRRLLVYFDYTFISGEIRIVRVINGKFRRKYLIFDSKDVFILGKVGSVDFEKLYSSSNVKKKVATPNGISSDKELYYLGVNLNGEKNIVIMECREEFLSHIVAYVGRNVIEQNYGKN